MTSLRKQLKCAEITLLQSSWVRVGLPTLPTPFKDEIYKLRKPLVGMRRNKGVLNFYGDPLPMLCNIRTNLHCPDTPSRTNDHQTPSDLEPRASRNAPDPH
eukprot:1149548-Pelagomonas_calceolata.AAC.1